LAGSGETPEPTVKSGWEKMEVLAIKMQILTVYLTFLKFIPLLKIVQRVFFL
jgi:hypothetical protein